MQEIMTYSPVSVKIWGDFACFTRPEMHTERVTYETPTPSAARGILEAIFWHKPMKWHVREIRVLKPIRHFSILRNEVISKASVGVEGIDSTDPKQRAQRHSLILRDVAYIITADAFVSPGTTDHDGHLVDPAKYRDQFRRRVERGQCFQRPSLGCREFAADFGPVVGDEQPIDYSGALGRILFDMDYSNPAEPKARFFEAKLVRGVLCVPPELYGERSDAS